MEGFRDQFKKMNLSENEKNRLKEQFESVKKVHKNYFNSFEIIVPKISEEMVEKNRVLEFGNEYERFIWIKLPGTQFFFDEMIINYEREMGDNLCLKKDLFQCCFYCCTRLFNQGFVPSNRWVVSGFITVDEEFSIGFAWMHPYLRGKGIFRNFLIEYSQNFGPLMFEAPISPRLQDLLVNITEEIQNSPEMLSKYISKLRNWLTVRYKKNVKTLNDDEIMYAIAAINLTQCIKKDMDRAMELKIVISIIQIIRHCGADVDKIKEIFPDINLPENEKGEFTKTIIKLMQKNQSLGGISDRLT
jgi:hypothetical protein